MAIDFKYRVHEVSKDLGLQNKDISEVLKKYATEPKNHMTVLTDEELSNRCSREQKTEGLYS